MALGAGRRRGQSCIAAASLALLAAFFFSWEALAFVSPEVRHASLGVRRLARAAALPRHVAAPARGGEAEAVRLQVGDKVRAQSGGDDEWYHGNVAVVNDDGTYTVRWDQVANDEDETEVVARSNLQKVSSAEDFAVGDDVRAMVPGSRRWTSGVISKVNSDGKLEVTWDDPDAEEEDTADVDAVRVRRVDVKTDYALDERVQAAFPGEGLYYIATVVRKNKDGTFRVKWDDPDGGPEESDVGPKFMKPPPFSHIGLKKGQKYTATIASVVSNGAFVDIGCETEGFLHASKVSRDRVQDVEDYVEEGEEVDVWIVSVRGDGGFTVSMIQDDDDREDQKKDLSAFVRISKQEWHKGKVRRVLPFGAFVSVWAPSGEMQEGLLHVSQMTSENGPVDVIENDFWVGKVVRVRISHVDEWAGKMALSMLEDGHKQSKPIKLRGDVFKNAAPDKWFEGRVSKLNSHGAFVRVKEGDQVADGLLHRTMVDSPERVRRIEDVLSVGQPVRVRILAIDPEGKINWSMKERAR